MENPLYNTETYAYIHGIKKQLAMEAVPQMLSIIDGACQSMTKYKTPEELAQFMSGMGYGLFLARLASNSSSPEADLLQFMEEHSRDLAEAVLAETQTEQP